MRYIRAVIFENTGCYFSWIIRRCFLFQEISVMSGDLNTLSHTDKKIKGSHGCWCLTQVIIMVCWISAIQWNILDINCNHWQIEDTWDIIQQESLRLDVLEAVTSSWYSYGSLIDIKCISCSKMDLHWMKSASYFELLIGTSLTCFRRI